MAPNKQRHRDGVQIWRTEEWAVMWLQQVPTGHKRAEADILNENGTMLRMAQTAKTNIFLFYVAASEKPQRILSNE